MSPTERRTALIRLLAEIDQQDAAAEDRAYHPCLSFEERSLTVLQWKFRHAVLAQVEKMLKACESMSSSGS